MVTAAEAFSAENSHHVFDKHTLLHFRSYISGLRTQPITISKCGMVGDMIESYAAACVESPELRSFTWARSLDLLRSTLDDFISTKECFFHLPGHMPFVKATFCHSTLQSPTELSVELAFDWNPLLIEFDGLQNVYHESRAFALKPYLPEGLLVEFDTEFGSLLPWDEREQQFKGHWPPILASMAGAERLESFTMPLNMTAQATMSFPSNMLFERTIRLAIPITIKRKPETCSGYAEQSDSPAVRRPAHSYTTVSPLKLSSTNTTPLATSRRWDAQNDGRTGNPPSYKEISDLLKRKAEARAGPTSPLRLNSLSLAQL